LESRWGRLSVHAHRTGALDYGQYRRYDAYWAYREELIFRDIEDEFVARMNELVHLWHASLAAPSGWEEDDKRTEYHRREASKTHNDIGKLLLPWYKRWQREEKSLIEMWREFKEREKDPQYAEFLRKERQRLREMSREAASETKALAGLTDARQAERERQEQLRRKRRARLRR
jgi:hypothetical protein